MSATLPPQLTNLYAHALEGSGAAGSAGRWYRGNLHCHAGGGPPDWKDRAAAMVDAYRMAGYDFLNLSEHYQLRDSTALSSVDFLVLAGEECGDPHVVATGLSEVVPHNRQSGGAGLCDLVKEINRQGALAVVAHPRASSLGWPDLTASDGYVGIELYNHQCERVFGKGVAVAIWDLLLDSGRRVWGFASDDAHAPTPDSVGHGWIEVLAPNLTQQALFGAVRAGRFIATQGPRFREIVVTPEAVEVGCTPVSTVRFVGIRGKGRVVQAPEGTLLEQARFDLVGDAARVGEGLRIELVDARGHCAWSQPLWRQRDA